MFNLNTKKLTSVLALLVFLCIFSFFLLALRSHFLEIFRDPLSAVHFTGRQIKGFFSFHSNMERNEVLARENDLLKRKLIDMEELKMENQRLSGLLSLAEKAPYKVIASRVIARDPSNWSSIIVIDKGKKRGIKKGAVCVSFLGLIGRVVETGERTSKVMMINDPNMGVSAMVERSRQEGLVTGSLGGSLTMKYLTKDSDIQVSDTVMTSGLTPMYPKGILIGTVVEIGEEFLGLSRYAVIKPAVNLYGIEELLVIME